MKQLVFALLVIAAHVVFILNVTRFGKVVTYGRPAHLK
jgi:hypothetical protein